jgi:hypothetical protein
MSRISVKAGIAGALTAAAALGTLAAGTAHAATTPAVATGTNVAFAFETPNHSLALSVAPFPGATPVTTIIAGPGAAYSAPSVIQNGGGQIAIAVEGPNHTLRYYWQAGSWVFQTVGIPGSTYSAPSISRWVGMSDAIAAEGLGDTLDFYHQAGAGWTPEQTVGGLLSSVTAPSMVNVGLGQVTIAAQALGGELNTYANAGTSWSTTNVDGFASTASAPSLANDAGKLVLAAQGPGKTLHVYESPAPSVWVPSLTVGGAFSAPSVAASPGRVNVAVQGAGRSLDNYHSATAFPGSWTLQPPVAGAFSTYSAPSSATFGPDNLITAAGFGNSVQYYYQFGIGPWFNRTVPGTIA